MGKVIGIDLGTTNCCVCARSPSPFSRTNVFMFEFPFPMQSWPARYRDGILTVTLPKAEEAKPKQIPVS